MSVIRRVNFSDLTLEEALPVLKEVCTDTMEEFPLEYEGVWNIRDMDRGIVQYTQTSGIPAAPEVGEGEEFSLDAPVQGYDRTMKAIKVGVMIAITQEMLDDNKYQDAIDRAEALGRAVREAQKIHAARLFNNGFGDVGPDGVSLFNVAHPAPYPGAPSSSNTLATPADLSQTSLQDLITVMRSTTDMSGKKTLVRPKSLIVPAGLEFLAHELTQSEMKPQASTAVNQTEVNAVNAPRSRYGLQPLVFDYLTDDDAWFLAADKPDHKIFWHWRKQPAIKSWEEEKNEVQIMKISTRYISDYADWRGVAGTAGAA